jgi:transposase
MSLTGCGFIRACVRIEVNGPLSRISWGESFDSIQVPAGKTIHAIVDNYAAHKHPNVRGWLERHLRWTFHFTPTSASWLNAVQGFFATPTKRRLKRGVFRSVADVQAAINRFLEEHNQQSQPFTWTADPDKIIAAVRRGHQVLDSIH